MDIPKKKDPTVGRLVYKTTTPEKKKALRLKVPSFLGPARRRDYEPSLLEKLQDISPQSPLVAKVLTGLAVVGFLVTLIGWVRHSPQKVATAGAASAPVQNWVEVTASGSVELEGGGTPQHMKVVAEFPDVPTQVPFLWEDLQHPSARAFTLKSKFRTAKVATRVRFSFLLAGFQDGDSNSFPLSEGKGQFEVPLIKMKKEASSGTPNRPKVTPTQPPPRSPLARPVAPAPGSYETHLAGAPDGQEVRVEVTTDAQGHQRVNFLGVK